MTTWIQPTIESNGGANPVQEKSKFYNRSTGNIAIGKVFRLDLAATVRSETTNRLPGGPNSGWRHIWGVWDPDVVSENRYAVLVAVTNGALDSVISGNVADDGLCKGVIFGVADNMTIAVNGGAGLALYLNDAGNLTTTPPAGAGAGLGGRCVGFTLDANTTGATIFFDGRPSTSVILA